MDGRFSSEPLLLAVEAAARGVDSAVGMTAALPESLLADMSEQQQIDVAMELSMKSVDVTSTFVVTAPRVTSRMATRAGEKGKKAARGGCAGRHLRLVR